MFKLLSGASIALLLHLLHRDALVENWSFAAGDITPDGFTCIAALINGVYPGPFSTANQRVTIAVNLDNQLNDPHMPKGTSIASTNVRSKLCLLIMISIRTPHSTGMGP